MINFSSSLASLLILFGSSYAFSDLINSEQLNQLSNNKNKLKIINYGYNNFIPSPYSKKVAVITFDSKDGINIFEQSKFKKAFFKLAPHYSPQQTITNCGISSAIMILNTIYSNTGKTPPLSVSGSHYDQAQDTIYGQFIWTENNFYTPKVQEKLDQAIVEGKKQVNSCYVLGVSLDQLTDTLNLLGTDAKGYHVSDVNKENIEQFRSLVKSVTANPTQYVIAHYKLNLYLEDEGGHYSPIGAYDDQTDTVLILDTWAAANSWIWVKLEDLYKSMNTLDGKSYRGYILVNHLLSQK